MSEIGHNSGATNDQGISAQRLTSFIQRIERLQEDKVAIATDIKEVFSEAKSSGFDTKIMREVIRLRAMDPSDLAERRSLVELYMEAVGGMA